MLHRKNILIAFIFLTIISFDMNARDHLSGRLMLSTPFRKREVPVSTSISHSWQHQTMITGYKIYGNGNPIMSSEHEGLLRISDRQSIQVFFAILEQESSEFPVFKYRITKNSVPGSWHYLSDQDNMILAGLDHGDYLLEVSGSTSLGYTSMESAILKFQVIAPFHRRKAFYGIFLIPAIMALLAVFEYRTKTLRRSNKALREKEISAREVLKQKNLLSIRNKNIEDSLKYAQRIQAAMFTSESELKKIFPESFVIHKPKDIVSGDFFWVKKIGNKIFLAAADCTGHGVPGAFMSLIGLEFFRQIIEQQGLTQPSLILNEINRNFDVIFENMDELDLRDGMDLSFCAIDLETQLLEYAGAFNPLYIIRDGEIIEIKGDKTILGPSLGYGKRTFTNHEFKLEEQDILYMFSDGYADQFGGPEGKKFKYRRFRHMLLSVYNHSMDAQKEVLENGITDWKGDMDQVDDILVLGVKPIAVTSSSFLKKSGNAANKVVHLERLA